MGLENFTQCDITSHHKEFMLLITGLTVLKCENSKRTCIARTRIKLRASFRIPKN